LPLFTLTLHSPFIYEALLDQLNGIADVAPNPMVGAVLVHDGRIISEGYHRQYGQAHASGVLLQS
jgi:diaminohydroxyphosphoribosylaminopyrimidine deaminase/5-amino-6-(5-phosphoribosylamino)uracil reductase